MADAAGQRFRSGLLYGLVAYTWWGLVPLYFAALGRAGVLAGEVLAHRIAWAVPVLLALTAFTGGWADLFRVFRDRKLVLALLLSAVLLAANWLIYIHATLTDRVAEASLGYYMLPLVYAALATTVLGERLRPLHYPALALVALGVAIPFAAEGAFTWIAVALPVSFGIYGLVRKTVPVEGMAGLTVESLLMLPLSLGYLFYLASVGENHFACDWAVNGLIAFSGVVTVVPLLTFALSLRRLPLLAISFIQFLSPTVQMLIAVGYLGEVLTPDRVAAFACVWVAVAIFITDAALQVRKARQPVKCHGPPSVALPRLTR
ncbi:MAG: EamA family transporter RarD [Gemmataceae bacterium]|nr:EamA family transporter RarD [Gemmataceae bacterium]